MGYKIGSFNLRNIGTKALGKDDSRNLQLIAQIIKDEGFDVVALQEVLSEGSAFNHPESEYIKHSICMELGNQWGFKWAKAITQLNDKRNEGYAFLWNKSKLDLATVELSNGTKRKFYPRICNLNKQDMMRRPYYARFTTVDTISGGPRIELRLLCVHTYFGDDSAKDRRIRQNELDVLMKEIYPQISERRYGEYGNGMPSYTVLMGDYNVILNRDWKEDAFKGINEKRKSLGKGTIDRPAALITDEGDTIIATSWDNMRVTTFQDAFTTIRGESVNGTEQYDSGGYKNDYDHFSYEERQFEDVDVKIRRVDAVHKYIRGSEQPFKDYYEKVSDHVPIMMEIEFN